MTYVKEVKEKEGSAYQQTKRFAFGKSHFS